MKKILLAASAVFLCFFISCNDKSNSQAEKNLEASHVVNKAFETGDSSQVDNVVAVDFVDHTDQGEKNRDSLKAMISMMKKEFPDMKMELIKEVGDSEFVFSLMRFTGTSNGQMGIPKGPYDMHAIEVVKFKDGKAIEHWEYMQSAEMMKMMGPQPMDNKMSADSSNMQNK